MTPIKIALRANMTIEECSGINRRGADDRLASERFYLADAGCKLRLVNANYEYNIATYSFDFAEKYIHTYDYAPDECWAAYNQDCNENSWRNTDYEFEKRCLFRIVVRRNDNEKITVEDIDRAGNILEYYSAAKEREPILFHEEIEDTISSVNDLKSEKTIVLQVLTDTHATVNGTWCDTAANMLAVGKKIHPDAIIHLGDLTDGVVSRELTKSYAQSMLEDMKKIGAPLHVVLGNHDANYFANNPDVLTIPEQVELYQLPAKEYKQDPSLPYYYTDFAEKGLRLFFLSAYENDSRPRYGFDSEQIKWLECTLKETPKTMKTVIFSHDAPLARLDFWSDEIRGSDAIMKVLTDYQQHTHNLLAFIHGHTHSDFIYQGTTFPIISVSSAKCEDMTEKKPPASKTWPRELGTVKQECWEVLVIDAEKRNLDFIRFGAGENRRLRGSDMKTVITYGSFDLFHEGHYNILKRAKELGDYLIVGVTTEYFDESRGKLNVVDSLMERIEHVKETGFADKIIIEDHVGQKIEDIQKYGVDLFVLGSDWTGKYDYLREYCEVVYLERTKGISSTMLREKNYNIIRLGIMGSGRIARRFVPESKYVSGLSVEGVYNPHLESAQNFADTYELGFATDKIEELYCRVNAVNIATPHGTHYAYAKDALLHGKHVLCEKPLAMKKSEAEELFAIAKTKGLVLMEAIKTAHIPGFIRLLSMAKSGIIGEIRDVEACFTRLTDSRLRELTDEEYGGSFTEFGSYTVLPILKLLGTKYEDVKFESFLAENGVDVYTKAYFKYKNAMGTSKTGLKVKSEGQLLISGTNGYILVESPWWKTAGFEICYEDFNKNEKVYTKFLGDGLRYELSDFVTTINGSKNEGYKLTDDESVAIADIMEKFLAWRKMK